MDDTITDTAIDIDAGKEEEVVKQVGMTAEEMEQYDTDRMARLKTEHERLMNDPDAIIVGSYKYSRLRRLASMTGYKPPKTKQITQADIKVLKDEVKELKGENKQLLHDLNVANDDNMRVKTGSKSLVSSKVRPATSKVKSIAKK